jgi:hypothetical protein
VLLAGSVAVQLTVFVPFANVEPEAGTQLTITEPLLSVAVAVNVTLLLLQRPESVLAAMFDGQVITGACVSLIVTVNEQFAVLAEVSVAVQLTVLVPIRKVDPDDGTQLTLGDPQLSLAVALKVTLLFELWPTSAAETMLDGHEMVGACWSRTMTWNEQLVVLVEASVVVQVTVLVPFAKVEPEDGAQLTDDPAQLSPNVGAS